MATHREAAGHGGSGGRRRFPKAVENIGEDPARFLDRPIPKNPTSGDCRGALTKARIEGIQSKRVAVVWQNVERQLASDDDRDPRDHIMNKLDARIADLERNGESTPDDWHRVAQAVRAEHPEWDESETSDRPERRLPSRAVAPASNTTQASEPETTEATGLAEFAAAGGGADDEQ